MMTDMFIGEVIIIVDHLSHLQIVSVGVHRVFPFKVATILANSLTYNTRH